MSALAAFARHQGVPIMIARHRGSRRLVTVAARAGNRRLALASIAPAGARTPAPALAGRVPENQNAPAALIRQDQQLGRSKTTGE